MCVSGCRDGFDVDQALKEVDSGSLESASTLQKKLTKRVQELTLALEDLLHSIDEVNTVSYVI